MLSRLSLFVLVLACSTPVSSASQPPLTSPPLTMNELPGVPTAAVDLAVSPITLSDPDGQALTLSAMTARVAVTGPLALAELELRFENPQARRIEGRFSLTLPDGATVSRFAKEVDGKLVEGEVVERVAAHRVYDTILHQMRDPALLEQDAGNTFSAKIFPIEPRATVRVVLSYSQLLRREDGARAFTLPLRGLPTVGHFELHGRFVGLPGEATSDLPAAERSADGVQRLDVVKDGWTPDRDVAVRWRSSTDESAKVLRAGDYYLASFQPSVPVARAPGLSRWSFYVDTSASAADGRDHRIAAFAAVLRALPATATVEVRAFDQDVALLASGPAPKVAAEIAAKLAARGYAGGTDLAKVLADVKEHARADTRVVLATDGVATLGDTNVAHLGEMVPTGVQLSALVLGAEQDGATLGLLTGGRGRVVELPFSQTWDDEAVRAANMLAVAPGAKFSAADASAEWLHTLGGDDVRSGGEVLVLAKGKGSPVLRGTGREIRVDGSFDVRDAAPLLEREAVRAHLDDLALREAAAPSPEAAAALAAEQVRLSVTHRVLCTKTTLLVLESEADYERFGLDRRALSDILTVGRDGITTVTRPAWGPPREQPEKPVAKTPVETKAGKAKKEDAADGADFGGVDGLAKETEAPEGYANVSAGPAAGAPEPAPEPARALADEGDDSADMERAPAASRAVGRRNAPSSSATEAPRERRTEDARPTPEAAVQPVAPQRPDWTLPAEFPAARMAELEAAVARDPRDREAYNQLSDALYATGAWDRLAAVANAWQPYDPDNPQVYEMMGEAALARGDTALARRAFGSLAELGAGKPELLQRAGLLLWRAGDPALGEAPLRRALELRPDRVNSWRHLALLLRAMGRYDEAADLLEKALQTTFPDYYRDVHRVLREELAAVRREQGKEVGRTDALRLTLAWETDGNDVDLHVVDPNNEECYYSHKQNASGLELYEDLTQGLGPEVIRASTLPAGRYYVGVKYFSAGPMGVSRGLVVVEEAGKPPRVVPFRLVQGGKDMRLVATLDLG